MKYNPKVIYLEKAILNEPFTKSILSNFKNVKIKIIDKVSELKGIKDFPKNKRPLVLAKNRGKFLEKCPGTSNHICCNYYILNLGLGCPYDCTYCFLQFYQKIPVNIIYTNLSDLKKELTEKIGDRKLRIGTGEFMDSLAFEDLIPLNQFVLAMIYESAPNITLELKTKSTNIEILNNLKVYQQQIVIGWSLNPSQIAADEELFAPDIDQRLQAIQQVQGAGFRVAIHFDPIILVKEWSSKYLDLIDRLADTLDVKKLAWFSLGLMRFAPQLKKVVEKRHQDSTIIYGEFFPGADKKMRYPEPLRIEVLDFFKTNLTERLGNNIPLYFCMESSEVWQKVCQNNPGDIDQLSEVFS